MRAAVCGGAGFIGSTLVDRLLAEGHDVDVVDDLSTGSLANLAEARRAAPRLSFTKLAVSSPDLAGLLARRPPDVVYHLATPSSPQWSLADPVGDATATVLGVLHVLEAARAAGVGKVVVALGTAFYGAVRPGDLPVRESFAGPATTPRSVAERAVVGYLAAFRDLHELEHTAVLLGEVYGPRQDPAAPGALVARTARRLLGGVPGVPPDEGAGSLDLVFVDDAVDALARAADRGGGLVLNVASGTETTPRELHAVVASAVGADPAAPATTAAATTDGTGAAAERTRLDVSRAAIHLGWRPWTDLASGVAATVEWMRSEPV